MRSIALLVSLLAAAQTGAAIETRAPVKVSARRAQTGTTAGPALDASRPRNPLVRGWQRLFPRAPRPQTAPRPSGGDEALAHDGQVRFDLRGAQAGPTAVRVQEGGARRRPLDSPEETTAAIRAVERAPLGQQLHEAREIGTALVALQAGMWALNLVFALFTDAHKTHPALAGAVWALAGLFLAGQLAQARSTMGPGWQASHDIKMRVDSSTGRPRDIRSRKYGQDRYDEQIPGPVSRREAALLTALGLSAGLPWAAAGGWRATALYILSAGATLAAKSGWDAWRPRRSFAAMRGSTPRTS